MFPQETIEEMLRMCYQSEVERRRVKYIADDSTLEKIKKAAKWLCGDYKVGLLLYGSVGSGKTTLAKAICNLIGILYGGSSIKDNVFEGVVIHFTDFRY